MTSGYMYVLPDGMTIRLCMADAAGPDSKIHLNTTATWIDWGKGWKRLNSSPFRYVVVRGHEVRSRCNRKSVDRVSSIRK